MAGRRQFPGLEAPGAPWPQIQVDDIGNVAVNPDAPRPGEHDGVGYLATTHALYLQIDGIANEVLTAAGSSHGGIDGGRPIPGIDPKGPSETIPHGL